MKTKIAMVPEIYVQNMNKWLPVPFPTQRYS